MAPHGLRLHRWGRIDGAAQTEITARENRAALDNLALVPGPLADVSQRDASVSLLGRASKLPIIIGPTGFAGAFWREGDLALARAAAGLACPS